MKKIKIMSVFGTRPEAVKMCPLVKELQKDERFESVVCVTAQHRDMLDTVLRIFNITPDYDLDIMKKSQSLTEITARILSGIEPILKESAPDIVLVHGDTSTSFVVALAAFYQKIPVGHVEAGLRTYNKYSPFPEEMNRVLTGRIAELHFAPTQRSADNLMAEGIASGVTITGNTVLDTFSTTVRPDYKFACEQLRAIEDKSKNERIILMTAHRRENMGEPLENICRGVKRIIESFPDVRVIYPVHPNPAIHDPVHNALGDIDRVTLLPPLEVTDLHNLMAKSFLVLTDSGGLQEEGPSFKKPVLVLRTETERPEAVDAGCVEVIGVSEEKIVASVSRLLEDKDYYESFLKNPNPYGDGKASRHIADAIAAAFAAKA